MPGLRRIRRRRRIEVEPALIRIVKAPPRHFIDYGLIGNERSRPFVRQGIVLWFLGRFPRRLNLRGPFLERLRTKGRPKRVRRRRGIAKHRGTARGLYRVARVLARRLFQRFGRRRLQRPRQIYRFRRVLRGAENAVLIEKVLEVFNPEIMRTLEDPDRFLHVRRQTPFFEPVHLRERRRDPLDLTEHGRQFRDLFRIREEPAHEHLSDSILTRRRELEARFGFFDQRRPRSPSDYAIIDQLLENLRTAAALEYVADRRLRTMRLEPAAHVVKRRLRDSPRVRHHAFARR